MLKIDCRNEEKFNEFIANLDNPDLTGREVWFTGFDEEDGFNQDKFDLLLDALKPNKTITHIVLSSNDIGPIGTAKLAETLKVNDTITHIDLSDNNIGPEGVEKLTEASKVNKTITHIDLSNNNIGAEEAAKLAKAYITYINLSDNKIGSTGIEKLAEALKVSKCLTHIDLSDNNIGPEEAAKLYEGLEVNKYLTNINISDNNIGPEAKKKIAKIIKRNKEFLSNAISDFSDRKPLSHEQYQTLISHLNSEDPKILERFPQKKREEFTKELFKKGMDGRKKKLTDPAVDIMEFLTLKEISKFNREAQGLIRSMYSSPSLVHIDAPTETPKSSKTSTKTLGPTP